MVDAIAMDAAVAIAKLAGARAWEEVSLAWGFQDHLAKLVDRLADTNAFLNDAGNSEHSHKSETVNGWLYKVNEVAYLADDVMDDYEYEILRRKIELSSFMNKVYNFFNCYKCSSNPVVLPFRMTRKVLDVLSKFQELDEKAKRIGLKQVKLATSGYHVENAETSRLNQIRELADATSYEFVGRKDDEQKLLHMICNTTSMEEGNLNLSTIAIQGIGGLGKTTLTRRLYNHKQVDGHFGKNKVWVCVSEDFKPERILKIMLESLTLQNDGLSDIEAMTKKLQEKLKGDKYLLILDDVWEKSQSLWDSLINILQRIGDPSKNVILITTRSAEVANKARVTKTYSLNGLSEDDGWTLLQQKAFSTRRSGQKISDFEGVGRKIIRKCVGVPLAIKAMGAILQSKERPLDWESILTSELWDLPQKDENNILPSLRLSYNHLPHVSVKQCFAYCAVFPKDSKLNKHVLIALWMAQGLLPKSQRANSTTTMEHVGEDYFGFLLNNSFIEEEEVNEIGEVKWFKMHDLVHDLAIYVSKKNMLVWKAGSQLKEVSGARHFMIDFEKGKITPEMPPEVDICKLRTLNFMSGLPRWKSIICAQYMRVLILANIGLSDIPNGIEQLIHLRYLDLSGNDIKTLPESVFKLYQLQTLILKSNYFLEELPAGLYKLENLMHIKTNNLLSIPRGLGLLTNLQTLPSLELNDEIEGWKIDELENLNHIKGKVWISGLENVKNKEEAEKASLRKKIGIQKVRLKWNHVRKESNKNEMMKNNDEDVLGSLEPPPYMKSLSVTGFMGLGFPRWMKTMDLIMVELIDCERCGQLPTLGQLPNLKILKLEGFKKVEIIGNEFYYESSSSNTNNSTYNVGIIGREDHKLFGALKKLYFTNFECLTTWMPCPVTTAFPSLENLEMRDCPNLEKVPTLYSQSLKYLYLDNVGGTQTLDIIKYNHTNLEKLKISDCKNLKSFPNGEVEMMMTSLKELDICDCPALGGIPTSIDNCTSLKSLTIRGCSSIEGPVPDLSKLQSLEGLDLRNSGELLELEARSIPQLYHLRELKIGEFREKEEIISFVSQIKSSHSPSLPLRNVELIGWPKVKNMPQELQHLLSSSTLQRLEIVGFDELDALPEWIGNLSSLQALWLFDCEELKYLPSKQAMLRLSRLQHIHIINCPQLKERCSRQNNAPDSQWPNIQHIPNIVFH